MAWKHLAVTDECTSTDLPSLNYLIHIFFYFYIPKAKATSLFFILFLR